jgi:diadenosine tetraphosphate (Ap4A) HIT family hydrolase/CTP:molybdopterin cytidylyltransferase MocA
VIDLPVRWTALVLAAGKGTRMKSDTAKVLHQLGGRTLLSHVLDTASHLPLARILVVVGFQAEEVVRRHATYGVETVLQEPQLGTGHAVLVAEPALAAEPDGTSLLVLYGDVPLLREQTLSELMERHLLEGNGVTVLTARVPDPTGYGRIVREADGGFRAIVEDRDLEPGQRPISEINSGIYAFQLKPILRVLHRLRADNAQKEYYLTDALALLAGEGERIGTFLLEDPEEIAGINTTAQLDEAEAVLERRSRGEGGCPVCRILACDPAAILEDRGSAAVLLAPVPYNSGHLWIVPRRHLVSFEALTREEASALFRLGQEAERWSEEAYHPQAFNLAYNSGRAGVHLALHLIPRWAGDSNFMPIVGGVNLLPETPAESRNRILEARARCQGKAEG